MNPQDRPQQPRIEESAHFGGAGMMRPHEAIHQPAAPGLAPALQFLGFSCRGTQGLFAQDRLALLDGSPGPFRVQVSGEGVVHHIHFGMAHQFLIAATGNGNMGRLRGRNGPLRIPAGQGHHPGMLRPGKGGQNALVDLGDTQDSPSNRTRQAHRQAPCIREQPRVKLVGKGGQQAGLWKPAGMDSIPCTL